MLEYVPDAKSQIYIPAALVIVGCAIVKPIYLPFAAIIAVGLVLLKIQQYSTLTQFTD
jgi:hypothetical protein